MNGENKGAETKYETPDTQGHEPSHRTWDCQNPTILDTDIKQKSWQDLDSGDEQIKRWGLLCFCVYSWESMILILLMSYIHIQVSYQNMNIKIIWWTNFRSLQITSQAKLSFALLNLKSSSAFLAHRVESKVS